MSGTSILAKPVQGKLSSDGRLLTADSKLLGMHFAAGGAEGGVIAIPSLLAIIRQSVRLGMGLARQVMVADIDGYSELWVETYLQGEVVQLSILSIRPVDVSQADEVRLSQIEQVDGFFAMEIDAQSRLIALHGQFPSEFDYKFIGKALTESLHFNAADRKRWDKAVSAERSFAAQKVGVADMAGGYAFGARPAFASDGRLTGYRIDLSPLQESISRYDSVLGGSGSDDKERFFGQKLAPALRQPLGRIIANAETIGAKLKGPLRDNYAVYAKDISDAAKHLVSLVDDLGDMEAVERPGFNTAKEDVDLGDAARRISGLLALKAADHQIRISLPDGDQKVVATAEFRRVLQILLNLVNNAIRYSPDGTEIKLEIAELQETACITICDEGAGIGAEDAERIFEKFERLGRSGDGGSGLGLYISRRLARAMDGDLTVGDSRGGGACFALTLPAAAFHTKGR